MSQVPQKILNDWNQLQIDVAELFPDSPPVDHPPRPGHYVTEDPPLSVTCFATMFGLNWNGSYDMGDNGKGNFKDPKTGQPYNTRDRSIIGVSLPREIMMSTFSGFDGWKDNPSEENIEILWAHHEGAVQKFITENSPLLFVDSGGHTLQNVQVVDSGPSAGTNNGIDFTYAAAHLLDTHGKALATYKIVVGGKPVEIKGWNWAKRRIG